MAHEIGHNLNMDHDFVGSDVNAVRRDSQGNSCTKIGGVMDYYGTVSKWSTCSVEDFQSYFNRVSASGTFCMATDTQVTTTTTRSTTTTTRSTTTRTTTRSTTRTTTRSTTTRTTTRSTTTTSASGDFFFKKYFHWIIHSPRRFFL